MTKAAGCISGRAAASGSGASGAPGSTVPGHQHPNRGCPTALPFETEEQRRGSRSGARHPFVLSNSHPGSSTGTGNPAGRAGKPCLHPGVPLSQAFGLVRQGALIKARRSAVPGLSCGGWTGRGGQRARSPCPAPRRRLAEGSLPAQGLPQTPFRRSGTCQKAETDVTSPTRGGTCCNNRRESSPAPAKPTVSWHSRGAPTAAAMGGEEAGPRCRTSPG